MAITQAGTTLSYQIGGGPGGGQTGTVSTAITVPADAEIVIVGVSNYVGAVGGMTSLTFTKGGVDTAMTKVTGMDASTSTWQGGMFYLAAPDTGASKTLKWSWSQPPGDPSHMYGVTFWKGIDTSSPVRSTAGNQAAAFTITTPTLTAQSGDLIVAFLSAYTGGSEGTATGWTNLSTLSNLTITTLPDHADGAFATGSPSGNTTVSATSGTNMSELGLGAIVLKPAAAAAVSQDIPGRRIYVMP